MDFPTEFFDVEQPEMAEFYMEDGVFIKQIVLEKAGYVAPQHSHNYDHTSMLAVGSVRAWRDGIHMGDFKAPTGIIVRAHSRHAFQALTDGVVMYCIHNTHGIPPEELEQKLVDQKHEVSIK